MRRSCCFQRQQLLPWYFAQAWLCSFAVPQEWTTVSWSLSFRGRASNFTCRGLVSERRSVRSFRDVFPVSRVPFLGFPRTHREEFCTCFPLSRHLAHLFRASEKHRVRVLRTCVLTPRPGGFGTSIPPFYSSRRGLEAGRDASTVPDEFRGRGGHPRRSEITKGSDTKRKTMHQCPPFGPVWCCQPPFPGRSRCPPFVAYVADGST